MTFDQLISIYGLYLGIAGIVITVILSIWSGVRKSKRRSVSQRQQVGMGGTGIQVGGSVSISERAADNGREK